MPMIGHEAVRQHAHRHLLTPFGQDALKRGVVARLLEQPHPSIAAIENMIDQIPWCGPSGAPHKA